MIGRRAIIIASQCRKLNHLSFFCQRSLSAFMLLMINPGPGECLGTAGDPPGLLLDPTVDEAERHHRGV